MVVGGAAGEVQLWAGRAFDEPSSLGVTCFLTSVPSDEALGWHISGGEDSQFPWVTKSGGIKLLR